MKFLIDVNVGGPVNELLTDSGHDIAEVRKINPRMPDWEILDWAVRENRIIITTDNDFEKMIWQQGKAHCGVLRLENLPRAERMDLLKDVLSLHGYDLLSGYIVIADSNKYRIRKPS